MRILFAALFLACVTQASLAAPASTESVETLLKLTNVEKMMDSMYSNMEKLMQQSMRQTIGTQPVTPQQQRALDKAPAKFIAAMRQEFSWAQFEPELVKAYQETFQQEEVDGLIQFYRTPLGQSYLTKMPTLMQRTMGVAQSHMQTFVPRMMQAIDEAVREAALPPR